MTFEDEKKKLHLEHRLSIKRMMLEKIALGLLIGIAALLASVILENYKNGLEESRFLLENRMMALRELRTKYSVLSDQAYLLLVSGDSSDQSEVIKAYNAALSEFIVVANHWSFLFSKKVDDNISKHVWIHQAMADGGVEIQQRHWSFLVSIFHHFDEITRKALWDKKLGLQDEPDKSIFRLVEWNSDQATQEGAARAYFEANYRRWIEGRD